MPVNCDPCPGKRNAVFMSNFGVYYDGPVSSLLPRLRNDLDFMPSPVEDRPGLLIRDSMGYSHAVLIVPPELVQCLACFDGEQTTLDLRAVLVQLTGELQVGDIEEQLTDVLTKSGFLEDETFANMKADSERAFAEAPVRAPSHAGTGYPDDPVELRRQMDEWMPGPSEPVEGLCAIAAPAREPDGWI
jgi:hypothetical protein